MAGACSGKTEHAGSPARSESASHLLMVVELEPALGVAKTLSARSVELPLPKRRGPLPSAAWRVDVLSRDARVLFSAPLSDASALRGEFRDEASGELRGEATQKRVTALPLRLPWLSDARQVRIVNVSGGGAELGHVDYPEQRP